MVQFLFQVFVRYPLHFPSLVPKYCLMLIFFFFFLSLRSKYYGDAVKVVASVAGKVMVYGKKNHSDWGETCLLNDIFRERKAQSQYIPNL